MNMDKVGSQSYGALVGGRHDIMNYGSSTEPRNVVLPLSSSPLAVPPILLLSNS
jgi:hypothetical protein